MRRTEGADAKTFVAVFEGHAPGKALVRSVKRLDVAGGNDVAAIVIETTQGRDYVVSQRAAGNAVSLQTPDGVLLAGGALTIISVQNGKVLRAFTADGSPVNFNGSSVSPS